MQRKKSRGSLQIWKFHLKITRKKETSERWNYSKKYQEISEPNKKQYVYAELEPAFLQSKSTICGYRRDSSGT